MAVALPAHRTTSEELEVAMTTAAWGADKDRQGSRDTVGTSTRPRPYEVARLAHGWRLSIQIHERLRRGEEGRPLLELMKNEPGPV